MPPHRHIRYLPALVLAVLLAPYAQASEDDVWALLKQPGHLVILRHSNAPGATPEPEGMDLKNCAIQRNLDDEGRTQARHIGDAFRSHGIAHIRLVSSQFCRALETARLTKLGAVAELSALNLVLLTDFSGLKATAEKSTAFMKSVPPKQLTVMVTHVGNALSISGANLSSGEMAVVHLDPSGKVVVDGRIMVP
jgi:phosphohistidine phosphatase SixA